MFFILGRGRSGTTLLSSMLNQSRNICVAPEGMFIMNLHSRYVRCTFTSNTISDYARDIWLEKRMYDWGFTQEGLRRFLMQKAAGLDFSAICLLVYRYLAQCRKKPSALVGDKNPHYALFSNTLVRIFPHSRFIHLVRDYRDNIKSYAGVDFDLFSIPGLAWRWVFFNSAIEKARQQFPHRFITVRYEDLLTSPENQLRRICSFLKTDYTPEFLNFHRGHQDTPGPWHTKLSQKLDPSNIGLWKESLPVRDVWAAESICDPFARRYGYYKSSHSRRLSPLINLSGLSSAAGITLMEKLLFRLPLRARSAVITAYRRKTGSI